MGFRAALPGTSIASTTEIDKSIINRLRSRSLVEEITAMLYQRSQEIEKRLEQVLGLVRTGSYSTPKSAEEVGVSIPTVLSLRDGLARTWP